MTRKGPVDLDAILLKVLEHFKPLPHRISIDWVSLDDVDPALFDEDKDWACCYGKKEGVFIGLNPELRSAPLYVLKYLVFHEVLHLAIPPRRGNHHHQDFNTAERLWPGYIRAVKWLKSKHLGVKH